MLIVLCPITDAVFTCITCPLAVQSIISGCVLHEKRRRWAVAHWAGLIASLGNCVHALPPCEPLCPPGSGSAGLIWIKKLLRSELEVATGPLGPYMEGM